MAKAKHKYGSSYDLRAKDLFPAFKARKDKEAIEMEELMAGAPDLRYKHVTYPLKFDSEALPLQFNPFINNVVDMEYVGSRVTCNPAPTDTDEDVLIYTDRLAALVNDCKANGFIGGELYFTPDGETSSQFISLRKGNINLIVTHFKDFYDKFLLATHVCKTLNVMEKQHRIVVFQAVLYDKKIEG